MGLGIDVRIEEDREEADRKRKQRDTVRWVLDTPRRLQELVDQDKEEEAEKEWREVNKLLANWKGVSGVQELQEQCEEILEGEDESE